MRYLSYKPSLFLIITFLFAILYLQKGDSSLFPAHPIAGRETRPVTLHGAAALDQLKQEGQYESLKAAMNQARFSVSRTAQTPLGRAAWHAPNPAAGYHAYVTEEGVSIAVNEGSYVTLSLHSIGYGAALRTVAPGEVGGHKQTINLTRGNGVREWYVNGPDGLEQGFTLAEPPGARQLGVPLRLALQVSAGWRAVASDDGKAVTMSGAGVAVEYGKLVVTDSLGRSIPARLTVVEPARLRGAKEQVVIEVEDSEATYPLTIDPIFTLQQRLTAADGAAQDYLGHAVALSGDTALVGAPYDDLTGMEQGSAYIFVRNGATWTQQARLTTQDGASFDYFGWAVAIDGDYALVGAIYGPGSVNPDQGAVYVFVRNGATWTQQARLNAVDGQPLDQFGAAVALDGQTALIGAYTHQISTSLGKTGAAYVFTRNGSTWTQQARLNANDGEADDQFGAAVALDDNTALIGAPADNVGTNVDQGSAYIFTRNGGQWGERQKLTAINGAAKDSFGNAVALSGETALIGAHLEGGDARGAVYSFKRGATAWTQTEKVGAPNPMAGAHFGVSVALSGDTAVIGASLGLFTPGEDKRSAYVYARHGSNWVPVRHLGPELGLANDGFGYAVALDGDTVLVGAYRGDANATDQGAAYAFVLHDGRHVEQQQLTANDGDSNDRFGSAVALSGDTLAVGAPNNTIGANSNQGSVYVFTRSGTAWTLQQTLTANDGAAGDEFGFAVALSDDTLAIGARGDTIGANRDQGSVYVFTRSGTTWALQQKLTANDGAANDYFGFAVALSGDTVVVGAVYDTIGSNAYQGSAYIFTRIGATWTQQQKLTANDGAESYLFGFAVALSGDTVAVGAPNDTIGTNGRLGSVCIFTRSNATWTQQPKLTANDGAANDLFGVAVALIGDTLVVGARGDTIGANDEQGSAYVFTRKGTVWTQQQKLTARDGAERDFFGAAVALSGDTVVVGALYHTIGANANQGSAYVFTYLGSWVPQQKLTAGDGAASDYFGAAVALSGDTVAVGAPNDTIATNIHQGSVYVLVSPPCPALAIAPASLPNGALSSAYHQQLSASGGGVEDYQFTVSGGALPPGLTLDPPGLLHGTPTATGTYSFTITTTFLLSGCTGSRDYTITVTPPCPTITVTPDSLSEGRGGQRYSQQLSAGGGAAPYSYATVAGALPSGISLSAAGVLSGATTVFGDFSFTVLATDANGCTGTRAYMLTIAPACDYTLMPASQSFAAAGGRGEVTVTTGAGCKWTATSSASWLTIIDGANGTGAGQVTYYVATNKGTARQAEVTVAGQTHYVQQAAAASETPRIVRLTPNSARRGTGGMILNVIGTSFTPDQRVQWNGSNLDTSFLSAMQLLADIPADALSDEGTATVLVVDTANGAQSNPGKFRVTGAVAHASAASYNTITLAPDSIVAAFGDNLATEVRVAESLPLPTELAGTTVTVRDSQGTGTLAELFFVAPTQVNYLMPPGLANGVASVTITNGHGVAVESLTEISAVAPGLFSANASGGGAAAAVVLRIRANGEQVYESVARYDEQTGMFELLPIDLSNAAEQVYLILFGSGIRHRGAPEDVTIELGETELPVVYAGEAPGAKGLDQVNVLLPPALRGRGQQHLTLRVKDEATNGVNVRFQ